MLSSCRSKLSHLVILSSSILLGGPSFATTPYVPTTTVSAQTSNNTSASSAFTDTYFDFNTGKVQANANGDMIPANISKLPVSTLLSGAAASAPVWVETQTWFCTKASNIGSNGLLITGTAPRTPACGSHIDVGYNSGDATQIANTVTDLESRGISGVILDWEGPPTLSTGQTNVQNNDSVDQIKTQAEASNGKFQFVVQEDEGVAGCTKGWWPCRCADGSTGSSCNLNTQAIYDINYLINRWARSPAYLHSNGAPVIYSFGLDAYASAINTTVNWAEIVAGLATDPVTGKAPILIFENSGGMTHVDSSGAYSWIQPTLWTSFPGSDPFSLNWLANDFSGLINAWKSYPTHLVTASAFKGFDDTVVNGWGSLSTTATDTSRYVDQQCGLTWMQSFAQISSSFSEKAPTLISIPTWDDYEEATEIQTGIDNCLTSLSPSLSGRVVAWTPTFGKSISGYLGNESTVHHYVIYVSQDGENLMPLPNVASGTHSLDISQYGLPVGTYQIFVQAVGQPMLKNTFEQASGTYTVQPTPGTISGTISDYVSGAAIAGATVTYSGKSTTTNSSGQYKFTGVPPGSYSISANSSGYLANSGIVSVTAGVTSALNLSIATSGIISGTVKSSTGVLITGASVTVKGGVISQNLTYTSSTSGTFNTSSIPVGSYTINCSASGYSSGSVIATVATGQTATAACTLTSLTGTLSGTIKDASSGSPISGASVSYSGGSTTTNSSGQFTFSSVTDGTYTLSISANNYKQATVSATITGGVTDTVTASLTGTGVISGMVTNSAGSAISGASIAISGGAPVTNVTLSSGSNGSFTTTVIPVGSYSVTCSASGYSTTSSSVTLTVGQTLRVPCSLQSLAGTLTGKITNASTGIAISGATVSYSGGSTTTNSTGVYTFSNVAPNSYTITVSSSGMLTRTASATVSSGGTTTTNVQIAAAGEIGGEVQSYSGPLWPNASITMSGGIIPTTVNLTSDSSGKFQSSWIPVGTYTVTCTIPYPATESYTVTISAGQNYSLDCKL